MYLRTTCFYLYGWLFLIYGWMESTSMHTPLKQQPQPWSWLNRHPAGRLFLAEPAVPPVEPKQREIQPLKTPAADSQPLETAVNKSPVTPPSVSTMGCFEQGSTASKDSSRQVKQKSC